MTQVITHARYNASKAVEAYLSIIRRFADFDETVLFEAYDDSEK